jgi:hypothetical protein
MFGSASRGVPIYVAGLAAASSAICIIFAYYLTLLQLLIIVPLATSSTSQ